VVVELVRFKKLVVLSFRGSEPGKGKYMELDKIKNPRRSGSVANSIFSSYLENLSKTGRSTKQIIAMGSDSIACLFSLWIAYSLRFGETYNPVNEAWPILIFLPIITLIICISLGIYRWVIRSSTKVLTLQIIKASVISSFVLLALLFLVRTNEPAPRSLFVIYGLLFASIMLGTRAIWQWLSQQNAVTAQGEPIAVFGAGSAGQQLVRLMDLSHEYSARFFIDDSRSLIGSTVSGLHVYDGGRDDITELIKKYEISRIVLAVPSIQGDRYADILTRMGAYGVPVQTTPSVTELIDGRASPDEIRDISINDLLGRDQVEPDFNLVRKCVEGKSVMVTGGGGSIGSELCRQIMQYSPDKLVILEQSEENLYKITEEIHNRIISILEKSSAISVPLFVPILGSVTDSVKVGNSIETHKIDTIYHAAAYKHVPIIESFPEEGVAVNVFGTKTVLDAAVEHRVQTFVLISTDKAVRPSNAMGASKRIAELVLQAKSSEEHDTDISMVRFGNVLGSSGSVVPKFTQQISKGGPVTITHTDIERYFMTIPEAAQLVLQASALAKGGEVFVLDMGEPVRIRDLAENMIRLHGKEIKSDDNPTGHIEIQVTGLRPGEKLFEELFISDSISQTEVSKIFVENDHPCSLSEIELLLIELREMMNGGRFEQLKTRILERAWSTESVHSDSRMSGRVSSGANRTSSRELGILP